MLNRVNESPIWRLGRCNHKRRFAFTLIELLVVVAIISLLVSILIPSLSKAKGLARQTLCMNSMRQINMVFTLYLTDNNGLFPLLYTNSSSSHAQDYRWYGNLVREGYPLEEGLLWCPDGLTYTGQTKIDYYLWGMFDHGYSLGLCFDYGVSGYPSSQAQIAAIGNPANTIAALDTRTTETYVTEPLTSRGRYFCDGVYNAVSSWQAGVAVARHDGKCSVVWVDGHVSMVVQPDPYDDSSLYDSTALTNYRQASNYWDRK